ncbi:MAG: nicotinate-nucleotide adenylyltransferase [bacterium]|nr:nicotinate-nucleotide adenylyltransferase [bacterium]
MKIGILGGTFNPVHNGHLSIANDVRALLALDQIIFIPAKTPALKLGKEILPADLRYKLVEKAIQSEPSFAISDIEFNRAGPSYSVQTLKSLHKALNCKSSELFFILGVDAFLEIKKWWHYQELFSLANFVVVTRAGIELNLRRINSIAEEVGFCYNGDIELTIKGFQNGNETRKQPFISITAPSANPTIRQQISDKTDKISENPEFGRSYTASEENNFKREGNKPRMILDYKNSSNLTLTLVSATPIFVSSTDIRERLSRGLSISELVPNGVCNLIKEVIQTK